MASEKRLPFKTLALYLLPSLASFLFHPHHRGQVPARVVLSYSSEMPNSLSPGVSPGVRPLRNTLLQELMPTRLPGLTSWPVLLSPFWVDGHWMFAP